MGYLNMGLNTSNVFMFCISDERIITQLVDGKFFHNVLSCDINLGSKCCLNQDINTKNKAEE